MERDQQFIYELTKQLVAELCVACQLNTSLRAKPKSSNTKGDLIYKVHSTTTCSGCMLCSLIFSFAYLVYQWWSVSACYYIGPIPVPW